MTRSIVSRKFHPLQTTKPFREPVVVFQQVDDNPVLVPGDDDGEGRADLELEGVPVEPRGRQPVRVYRAPAIFLLENTSVTVDKGVIIPVDRLGLGEFVIARSEGVTRDIQQVSCNCFNLRLDPCAFCRGDPRPILAAHVSFWATLEITLMLPLKHARVDENILDHKKFRPVHEFHLELVLGAVKLGPHPTF